MKYTLLAIVFVFTFTLTKGQDEILDKRIKQFYKVEEDKKLSKNDKIRILKEYIIPGPNNDSMAVFFYESWSNLKEITKKLKTKIIEIKYINDSTKAIITTEDYVTYNDGEKITVLNKSNWIKLNNNWYRDDKKSEKYIDGERVR